MPSTGWSWGRWASMLPCGCSLPATSGAGLWEADLSGADLRGTDLSRADLWAATLDQARVGWTTFGAIDLSATQGLDTVLHGGPSTIGIDTLVRSHGKVPEVFLRGAGVPEILITYLPSLTNRAIEFYSCFISYSRDDKAFARRLHDTLQGRGIRCWLDEHQI